jgi:hypothetical protein
MAASTCPLGPLRSCDRVGRRASRFAPRARGAPAQKDPGCCTEHGGRNDVLRERGVRSGPLPKSVAEGSHLRARRTVACRLGYRVVNAHRNAASGAACRLVNVAPGGRGPRPMGDLRGCRGAAATPHTARHATRLTAALRERGFWLCAAGAGVQD